VWQDELVAQRAADQAIRDEGDGVGAGESRFTFDSLSMMI
jgi:hypothetical protein